MCLCRRKTNETLTTKCSNLVFDAGLFVSSTNTSISQKSDRVPNHTLYPLDPPLDLPKLKTYFVLNDVWSSPGGDAKVFKSGEVLMVYMHVVNRKCLVLLKITAKVICRK